jgi:predicted pyridoxine 5'-phosphate oxidase superfamily flavin-nucleotide-binding protein
VRPASDIAFTPSVKAEQARRGSRAAYAKMERGGGWETTVTDELREFLASRDSCYLATANAEGQPYIQHRGGPPGFVGVVDDHTLAFADLEGNRQFITLGNLADNDRAFLFFMDYAHRRRVKVWGRARVVEHPERMIVFTVEAWDVNCPKHIPQKLDAAVVAAAIAERDRRIAELERENRELRARLQCV